MPIRNENSIEVWPLEGVQGRTMGLVGGGRPYVERITPGSPEWRHGIVTHAQRYRFAGHFVSQRRVLDAGCGTGYGSCMIADAGACQVTAVDISEAALKVAREHFSRPNNDFVCDDCEILNRAKGKFDVVLSLESLEHCRVFGSNPRFDLILCRRGP